MISRELDWDNFNSSLVIEVTRPEGKFTCSGVAIKHDVVLTAAHCLEGEILDIKVFNQAKYDPNSKHWKVEHFEIHPEYKKKSSNYKADLARIKLTSSLPENTMIYPIMKAMPDFSGQIIRLGYGQRSSDNVRTLTTPQFRFINHLDDVVELDDIYSFSGDSGGPVFLQKNGQMYLVAIHSTLSFGPEGKYSLNPMLYNHREWILASWN